jgi:pimeloyl-ACP methyl ester carboxylesterase
MIRDIPMKILQIRNNSGIELSIKSYGDGEETFLLLHGIPGSSHTWDKVAQLLDKAGARVLVPDLLGFGLSSRPKDISGLWLEAQAGAIVNALVNLKVTRVHLVGHDYGGPIAVTICDILADRVATLTLLATNTFTDTPIPLPLALIKVPMLGQVWARLIFSRPSLKMMMKQGAGNKQFQPDLASALGDADQRRSIATIFESALRDLGARYKSVESLLAKISIPTKVLWGTKDPFFTVSQGQRTAKAIRGARFIKLDGAGHFLPEECPTEVANELKELMR